MFLSGRTPARILSYCTNVHTAESVADLREALERHAVPLKKRLAPDEPFGLGLRLGERAVHELEEEPVFQEFAAFLAEHELFAYTVNAFPQGTFHGDVVKDEVYRPDWTSRARVRYTIAAARVLSRLLPSSLEFGTLSTVPLGFAADFEATRRAKAVENLLAVVQEFAALEAETGLRMQLCLEPEPLCALETIGDVIEFYRHDLLPRAEALPAREGRSGEELTRRHLGLCYDACHQAVEFDEPAYDFERLAAAGIPVGKVQLSSALELRRPRENPAGLDRLRRFAEPRFLHQVITLDARFRRRRFVDCDRFFAALDEEPDFDPHVARCHFHVPIHRPDAFPLGTTQPQLLELLHRLKREEVRHLEVETYTFSLLPGAAGGSSLLDDLEAEISFAREHLD